MTAVKAEHYSVEVSRAHFGLLSASMSTPPGRTSRLVSLMRSRIAGGGHSCMTKDAAIRSQLASGSPVCSKGACMYLMRSFAPFRSVLQIVAARCEQGRYAAVKRSPFACP